MKLAIARSGFVLLLASLLQSCGGGGGDGGGGGGGNNARLTISPTTVSVTAAPGDATPTGSVALTVSNPPAAGLFVEAGYSNSGIEILDFFATSATHGTIQVTFRSPGSLQNATYSDSIEVRVCTDETCNNEIQGSPVTVQTSYVVSGTGTAVATLDRDLIQYTVGEGQANNHTEQVRVTLNRAPVSGTQLSFSNSTEAIQFIDMSRLSTTEAVFSIVFDPATVLGHGTFNDTVTINVCYDLTCVRQVQGSPFTITTTAVVGVGAEFGYDPLEVESRTALAHDVLDAEFSKTLNQVVMVGSYPVNALYVYDVATGIEQQQLLSTIPSAVSVSPDGLTAAVGHDALISVVDLTTVGQVGAPAPVILNVATDVLDVILDGNGTVHALPRADQWEEIHSVAIATNTEQLSVGRSIYAGALGRLHPSGNALYTADNGLSPSDIEKWDVTPGVATWLYDSPYHGDYGMCGNLWFNETGTTIYTVCGNTFRSSNVQAQDMVYSGAIDLSPATDYSTFLIRHMSQSDARSEIALIEYHAGNCQLFGPQGPCYTHLGLYEDDFLNRIAVYSIAPFAVNDTDYRQIGLFVFHETVNGKKILLSRLEGMPNPDVEYYLSVVP